jgi:hypothetical protein
MEIKDRQICWRKSDEELSKPTDIDRPAAGVTWRTRANASQPSTRKVVRLVFLITRVIEIFDVDEKPLGNDRRGIGQNEKWPRHGVSAQLAAGATRRRRRLTAPAPKLSELRD